MKNKLSLSRIAQNALLACIATVALFFTFQVSPVLTGSLFTVALAGQVALPYVMQAYATGSTPLMLMAIQTEVWVADVEENLFFENEFVTLAVDHSGYVSNKTVHVPQAGANPAVVVDRSSDETAVTRRTDTDLTYNMANYTTDPVLIKDIESLQVSYSKRNSVLGQHIAVLNDKIGLHTLYTWAVSGASAAVIRTTGTDAGAMGMPNSTATGTRGLLMKMDLAAAALKLDMQKAPKIGRYAIIPSCMFYGLFTDNELIKIRALVNEDNLKKGVIGELFGFSIIVRGTVVMYGAANTNTLKAETAADATTDCAGAVCFSRYMVSQAKGSIKVYINEGVAKSYGDVMSAEVNHGVSRMRSDDAGVVCIAQTKLT